MGSDAEHKNELAPAVLARADRLVCDRVSQCVRLGELHHALVAGALSADAPVAELGRVIVGLEVGRAAESDITVCDLTGTGVQDTAIATHAYRIAVECGLGFEIEN
jgi:ornithine cyclodeaminase